ncbi:MAG: hypothetical protein ACYS3N_18415 [Planctomycetota bacterium]|jgi:hypothetical protein
MDASRKDVECELRQVAHYTDTSECDLPEAIGTYTFALEKRSAWVSYLSGKSF